jgi:AraC-like DNA-binding protein
MYAQQSLQDSLFLILYGGVAVLALMAGLYLWLGRSNTILPHITPPKALRRWTAAFFMMSALSHVWWYVLGVYWLTDDRLVRNIVAVTLDHVLLVPLVLAILLRLLQDRRHRLWPWALTQVPILVLAAVGIARRDEFYGFDLTTYWQLAVMTVFVGYYIYELIKYGRWLRENYADLEHKEVWQSLVFAAVLFIFYEVYFTNPGVMTTEYLAQVETIAIIAFLLWRVEALQKLDPEEVQELQTPPLTPPLDGRGVPADSASGEQTADDATSELTATEAVKADALPTPQRGGVAVRPGRSAGPTTTNPSDIGQLLAYHCEQPKLYMQYDLTLSQLAETIGTSREALGAWFADHDDTYNAYINRLRIDHFVRLYREAAKSGRKRSVFELANECGYRSYLSFYTAFRQRMGTSVMVWERNEVNKK